MITVKFKKLSPDAVAPTRAMEGDAGWDLTAICCEYFSLPDVWRYGTGIAVEIPPGYFGALFQRSSVRDQRQILSNCVGVIDSGYRGEITLTFKRLGHSIKTYNAGDRIGQLVILPLPEVQFEEVMELSESERGTGGFGHTGK